MTVTDFSVLLDTHDRHFVRNKVIINIWVGLWTLIDNSMRSLTYSDPLCTTWYPKPAALLVTDFQATGSTLKQSAAFNTEEKRRKNNIILLI